MENPSGSWAQQTQDAAPPPTPPSRQAPVDPIDELDEDPLADFADLPEPEFSFDDDKLESIEDVEEPVAEHAISEDSGEDDLEVEDDPLADLAALADDLDEEPDMDPLAELIKAEEAAHERGEGDDSEDTEFDEAVADELVKELTEQTLRDDLDLQQLERSLKVVPFPAPDGVPAQNGHHKHADQIAEDADEALEAHPMPPAEPAEKTASAKARVKAGRPGRAGRNHTKFKPSMVMAGVEPSIQGYLQGDPLETWRDTAVEAVWGEGGLPSILSFEAPAQAISVSSELRAIRPERDFHGRMGLPIAVCTPAEAPAVETPLNSLEPTRIEAVLESPQALSLAESSSIRLGPEYRVFDGIAAIEMSLECGAEEDSSAATQIPAAVQLPDALTPAEVFYDSVPVETRFVEEDDWEAPAESPDPSQGIDLSADFSDEQPTAHSSGGGRLYR